MKTIAHQHREVHYSPVYLSGLKSLIDIYREQGAGTVLNAGFGLPLVQASLGTEVLGFSSVSISEEGSLVIRYFGKAGFDTTVIRQELAQRAQEELDHSFGKVEDVAAMQTQITRLIGWLNNCN
ncbi:hypothetical protein [Edaphocola aurantiacus]|uniref:hypothetical protein n=1 Tax=Edaphocola aurantiacus TaxID=2601682 RepID=UPI001C94FDB5|nr:hypothetical protein [Edaphocola aurantiacus]